MKINEKNSSMLLKHGIKGEGETELKKYFHVVSMSGFEAQTFKLSFYEM